MKELPLYDPAADVACTIAPGEIPGRIALFGRLRSAMISIERTADGLLLRFREAPDVRADVERFTVDEKRCCQFWGFQTKLESGALTLRWEAPPTAQNLIDRLFAYFTNAEPTATLAGLL